MPGVYFADTFYWIALAHPKDAWHASPRDRQLGRQETCPRGFASLDSTR